MQRASSRALCARLDSSARSETINVLDAVTGVVLNSQVLPAGSFHNGEYLVWNVQGHVQFQIIENAGANAVISGVFFVVYREFREF